MLGDDSAAICKWLSVYVAEARKQDSSPFPPKSLLQAYCATCVPRILLVLETTQLEFVSLHNSTDNIFRKLRVEGVQAENRSTEAFNKEEIGQLWGSGSLYLKGSCVQFSLIME